MTVPTLTVWKRERERVPFDAAAFNRIVNFLQGYIAAPFRLVQVGGNFALIWDPATDLFTFGASIRFNATLTLDNTIWLDGYKADHLTSVHLIRVNASDIIELGAASQRMSINASLTNNSSLTGRDAANANSYVLIKLNTSDVIELGETGRRLTIASPLLNNTNLAARNAANSVTITLIKLNASDIIELGESAQRLTFLSPLTNNAALTGRNAANAATIALINLNGADQIDIGQAAVRANLLGNQLGVAGSAGAATDVLHGGTTAWGPITAADLAINVPAMLKIAETTLGGAAGSIDFTNIPQTYRGLLVEISSRNDTGTTTVLLRFSSDGTTFDTGANYDHQYHYGSAATSAAVETLGGSSILVGAHSTTANVMSAASVRVLDYANASYHKTVLSQASLKTGTGSGNLAVYNCAGFWRDTSAIKGIRLLPGANNFATGTRATLYGEPA